VNAVALLPGLYVNAHALLDRGPFYLWRPTDPRARSGQRRELSARLGVPVFVDQGQAWCLRRPGADAGARREEYRPADRPALHRAAVREGLRELALSRGFEAWFGFGGEVHCAPVDEPPVVDGPVRIEPVLKLRVVGLGEQRAPALVSRYDSPWRFSSPLSDPVLRGVAVGQRAVRVGGDGPRSGRVDGFDGESVLLRAGGMATEWPSAAYALTATPALVHEIVPNAIDTIGALYAASRSLLRDGRPDQYAVQERQQRAALLLARLGDVIGMPAGGSVEIEPTPVQVKVRDR
jgi:hypothetical protein